VTAPDGVVTPPGPAARRRTPWAAVAGWWFEPAPVARAVVLRRFLAVFVILDVLVFTPWVALHRQLPGDLYMPLFVGRWLPLPIPDAGLITAVQVGVLASAAVVALGRAPRAAGTVLAVLYFEWMVIAFSYGKVDHDRFALLVALAVLPTVATARRRDAGALSEGAGWALRCIQVAVVATYFLAALAKLRYGGLEWVNSATFARAVIRRGTFLADPLLEVPWALQAGQWALVAAELASPALLLRGRAGRVALAGAVGFHVVTFSALTISFLPHVVCLAAFLPLERIGRRRRAVADGLPHGGGDGHDDGGGGRARRDDGARVVGADPG
jgi:hypothetical protein